MFEGVKQKLGWKTVKNYTLKQANDIADVQDTINGVQFLVNTIYDICQEHGTDVNSWTLNDMSKMTDVFVRMQRIGKEG